MTTIITHAGGIIYPTLIAGYESSRESGNIAHPISGRSNPDYTLRPAALRTGTLTLLFSDDEVSTAEEASLAAEEAHALPQPLVLATAGKTSILMTYVVREGGRIARSIDSVTHKTWTLTVDFQEILP